MGILKHFNWSDDATDDDTTGGKLVLEIMVIILMEMLSIIKSHRSKVVHVIDKMQ